MIVIEKLKLVPMAIKDAARFNARLHRHNRVSGINRFAVGVKCGEKLVGVAIVGNPKARMKQDGETCEVTRCCTDGTPNACSMLYGAAARAAKALGFCEIITYTLATESGISLRAAGFIRVADVPAEETWSRASRPRIQINLFGEESRPPGEKIRWARMLHGNCT